MIKPGTVVNYKPVDSDGKRNSSSYQGLVIGSIFGSPKKNVVVLNIAGQHSYDLLNEDNQEFSVGKHQAQVDAAVIRKSRASYSMHKKYGELAPTKEQESAKSGKTEEAFDKAMMDVAQELSDSGYAVELKDKTTGETLADFSANMPEYAVVAVPKEALTEIPQQYIDAGYSPARYKSVAMEAVLNALSDDSYELHSHLVIDGDVFFIGRQKNENNS